MIPSAPAPATPAPRPDPVARDHPAREAAVALETAFLSQMLKSAGVGRTPDAFGGGAGETQFASFLRDMQARAMAEAGGIGLAEHIFHALAARGDDA
ncbi:rod-binding protein [Rhodosalinus sp. 5P4]|uniref:rod-binding protein n=1 Tax=Rhodosalinus sp. 5P4 TaxID=3239196 RepID=UPI0035257CD5